MRNIQKLLTTIMVSTMALGGLAQVYAADDENKDDTTVQQQEDQGLSGGKSKFKNALGVGDSGPNSEGNATIGASSGIRDVAPVSVRSGGGGGGVRSGS